METAYEAIYIVDTAQPDEQVRAIIDKYSGVVTRGGGVVDDVDRWDPRRLAYEVKGRREGVHIVMNFRSEPAARDELDRIFRISDDVLRHLVVKQDPNADRFPSRTRAAETDRREREAAARAAANPPPPAPAPVAETVPEPVAPEETAAPEATPAPQAASAPADVDILDQAPVVGIPNEEAAPPDHEVAGVDAAP
jgi:small subunit ribosomal protein S6